MDLSDSTVSTWLLWAFLQTLAAVLLPWLVLDVLPAMIWRLPKEKKAQPPEEEAWPPKEEAQSPEKKASLPKEESRPTKAPTLKFSDGLILKLEQVDEGSDSELCPPCDGCGELDEEVENCPDCCYTACEQCLRHTNRGTCRCLNSNFGTAYCDMEPAWHHMSRDGQRYRGPYKCQAQLALEDSLDFGRMDLWSLCSASHQCCRPEFKWCQVHKVSLLLFRGKWPEITDSLSDAMALRMLSFLLPCIASINCKRRGFPLDAIQLHACSKCKSVRYCSQSCQELDYANHKHDCGPYISLAEMPYVSGESKDRLCRYPKILY